MTRALSSLTNRIFVALLLLATLSLSFAFLFANSRASAEAEAELARGLVEAATLVDQHRTTLSFTFTRMAHLVADLPKLKAAVETGDPPTVQPLADDYVARVDADLLVVQDERGRVLAESGVRLPREFVTRPDAVATSTLAVSAADASTFIPHERGVLQIVSVAILPASPEPVGVLGRLTVGFLMDDALAARFRDMTGSEIAFAADGRILASSLPAAAHGAMAGVIDAPGTRTIQVNGEEYVALARPMEGGADGAAPLTLTLRSRSERLQFLNSLRAGLIGALIVTLVLATVLSWGVATTMTRPLAAVTGAMREVAATGDLTRRVTVRSGPWDDADARLLASSFNTLTESIARFQRESAQKERLSSLGRLSTVIAHEIRNPLMIIRASLSTLRGGTASDADQREAIADIDDESRRINRIVTEVLDFAKPIRFELAATNLNEVCRQSAAAAWADQPEAGIDAPVLALDASLPTVVTDAERVRTALVNLLTNARQAVEHPSRRSLEAKADPSRRAKQSPVTLTTFRRGERVVITVRDTGTGIMPEDMARIFDPYFTTREAGTGIGLPITRHIVEGLGGTLSVTSAVGEGTEFRIELPASATDQVQQDAE
jgi:signal transduction histidine kinase